MGRYEEAIRWYGRGLRAVATSRRARSGDRLEPAQHTAFSTLSRRGLSGLHRRCNDVFEHALEIDDMQQLGGAYLLLHLVHTQIGSPERVAFRGLALPLFEELGNLKGQATVLNNLGIDAYYEGRLGSRTRHVRAEPRALRDGSVTSRTSPWRRTTSARSSPTRAGSTKQERSSRRCGGRRSAGHRGLSLMARLNLGRAAARAGRFDEAEQLLAEARDGFHEIQASSFEQEAHARLAEAAVFAGDHERALREVEFAELSRRSERSAPVASRAVPGAWARALAATPPG